MTNPSRYTPILSSLLLIGCASYGADMQPSSDKADGIDSARSGAFLTQLVTQEDGCGLDEDLHEPELVEVTASDDGNHFEYEEDGNVISCDRADGGNYDCTVTSAATDLFDMKITMDLKWSSADRFEGSISMKMDCSDAMSADFCSQLEESLPNGLPCETNAKLIATPPMADDFAPEEGNYTLTVGEPLPVTSCAQAFPVTPDQNALLTAGDEGRGLKLFDDDGGALAPFACFNAADGVIECDRTLELEGLSINSEIITVFSGDGVTDGALQVTLDCVSDDPAVCDDLSQTFGELPCRSVQEVSAVLVAEPDNN